MVVHHRRDERGASLVEVWVERALLACVCGLGWDNGFHKITK